MSKAKMILGAVCALGLVTGVSHAAPRNGANANVRNNGATRNYRVAPTAPNAAPNYNVTPDVFNTRPYNFKATHGPDYVEVPQQYGYRYTYTYADAYGNIYYRTVTLPYPPYYYYNNNPLYPQYYGYGR